MINEPSAPVKLAVIGGGSTYTPELVAGLARERERLDLSELVLHDIDPERREVVGGLGRADARRRPATTASSPSPTSSSARSTGRRSC